MQEIFYTIEDEDESLEQRCPFCEGKLSEWGDVCEHVVCAKGSLNPFIIINDKLIHFIEASIVDKPEEIESYHTEKEYADSLFDYCVRFLEVNDLRFPSLTKLTMCFVFSDEDIEKEEGSWIADVMEGPQDPCEFYLLNGDDLVRLEG